MQHRVKAQSTWIELHSTEAFLFNWGDASGIEERSTESRSEAPWIELRSTEAFNLKWAEIEVRSQAFLFNLGDAKSRQEAPWIEMHSTEDFPFLGQE